jgi:hypothetical protein
VISIGCACAPSGSIPKEQTGSCASVCASLLESPPCYNTVVSVTGSTEQYFLDTCSPPYAVGTGTTWDDLVTADLPANETVVSPPGSISCQCEGPTP